MACEKNSELALLLAVMRSGVVAGSLRGDRMHLVLCGCADRSDVESHRRCGLAKESTPVLREFKCEA